MKNAIDIMEAGYRLDHDDDAWLREVLASARASLDGGLGVLGFRFDIHRAPEQPTSRPIVLGADPRLVDIVGKVVAGMSSAERAHMVMGGPTVALSNSYFRKLGPAAGADGHATARAMGFGDVLGVRVFDVSGAGLFLAAPLPETRPIRPAVAQAWKRIAAHLGAALRLRRALASSAEDGAAVEAVLDPSGKVHHAEAAAQGKTARATLRASVLAMTRARGPMRHDEPAAAADLWRALVAGQWTLVDRFESDGRHFIVARKNPPGAQDPRGLSERERAVAHYLCLGHANKQIAYTLGLAEGTVGAIANRVAQKVGARTRPALAARLFGPPAAPTTEAAPLRVAGEELHVVAWPQPPASPALAALSASEREVALAVARGLSNEAIAAARGASVRTVVNQLASVYRKLGVGSRVELTRRLSLAPPPAG